MFLLYLGLVVPFDDGMPLLCLSWLPYALAGAGYCGEDLYAKFRHDAFVDPRAIAAERPEAVALGAAPDQRRAALAAACGRCQGVTTGARRSATPASVGGAPAEGNALGEVLTTEVLQQCSTLAQQFPAPDFARDRTWVPHFYDCTDLEPNTFDGVARPSEERVLLLAYVVVASRDVHEKMHHVLNIDRDDTNFLLAFWGARNMTSGLSNRSRTAASSSGGLELEAKLGLPCGFFDGLFYKHVRRGRAGFWGVGVFDDKQVRGAIEIAEFETYLMPSSSFAGYSPYRR